MEVLVILGVIAVFAAIVIRARSKTRKQGGVVVSGSHSGKNVDKV